MPRLRLAGVLIIAWMVCAGALVPARADARPLALEDYYRVVGIQAPAMSPDGRWVAFIKTTIVEADNRRQNELWIAATDESVAPRRLSDPSLNASSPRWTPDGRLLAFSARRRGTQASETDSGSIWFLRT